MTFASQIKFYRHELDLTQVELAELLDVPTRTLWDWEHSVSEPLAVTQEGVIARLEKVVKR